MILYFPSEKFIILFEDLSRHEQEEDTNKLRKVLSQAQRHLA